MFIARYWIAIAVATFALLAAYTSSPIYGQAATPTPDVNTVPPIELLNTPTNTPFPTPTPMVDDGGSGGQPGGELPAEPTATPDFDDGDSDGGSQPVESTPTPLPSNSDDDENNQGDDDPNGGAPVDNRESNNDADAALNGPTGVVNAVVLNLHSGPSTSEPIVDTLFGSEPVTILGRDSANQWWYVCCGSGAGREGWASAELITPDFDATEAESLLPVTATTAQRASSADSAALVLEMRPSPAFIWQGQTVTLQYVVRNNGEQPLTNVRLRNDLPPTLAYLETVAQQPGSTQTMGEESDGLIYTITWPEIAAGASLSATVTLQLAQDVPNGAMVDNLAVIDTAEGATAIAGITFAMPPLRPPLFR
jgi:uncharacterized repeat protein (TIGR01451 family)